MKGKWCLYFIIAVAVLALIFKFELIERTLQIDVKLTTQIQNGASVVFGGNKRWVSESIFNLLKPPKSSNESAKEIDKETISIASLSKNSSPVSINLLDSNILSEKPLIDSKVLANKSIENNNTCACKRYVAWEHRLIDTSRFASLETSRFTIDLSNATSRIRIEARDSQNRSTCGGDFWWVRVVGDHASFYVPIEDKGNGVYERSFLLPSSGIYMVRIVLEFSQCDAYMQPPELWFKNATLQGMKQTASLLNLQHTGYIFKEKKFTNIRVDGKFTDDRTQAWHWQPPCVLNPAHGFWAKENRDINYLTSTSFVQAKRKVSSLSSTKNTSSSRKPKIWFYGDSLQVRFRQQMQRSSLCTKLYECLLTYNWVYKLEKSEKEKQSFDNKDFDENRILKDINSTLWQLDNAKDVLLLNFGLHIVRSISLPRAQRLLDAVIQMARSSGRMGQLIWKTTTPPFIENKFQDENIVPYRFLLRRRVRAWNAYCLQKLCDADIPTLDVFWMAASFPGGPIDAVHYSNVVFNSAVSWLERYLT